MSTKPIRLTVTTGEQAKALRKKLGMTQGEFWGPLWVTQSRGSRYEAGDPIPEPVLKLLTVAYGSTSQCERLVGALRRSQG